MPQDVLLAIGKDDTINSYKSAASNVWKSKILLMKFYKRKSLHHYKDIMASFKWDRFCFTQIEIMHTLIAY